MTTFHLPQIREHAAAVADRQPPLGAAVDLSRIGPYRGYAEILTHLAELTRRDRDAPGALRASTIGRSVRGEPLFAIEAGPPDAQRAIALISAIHPLEWIGVEVVLACLDRLVADPPADHRVVAFPLVNPDGYRAVEADLRHGRRRFRRGNANGVDLNRNWPTHFRAGRGITSRLAGWNYGGPAPLSEPEVAAVVRTLDNLVASGVTLDLAASFHSIGQVILVPFGGRWAAPTAADALRRTAEELRRRLDSAYRIHQSARWVPGMFAYGMELDHLHAAYGARALLVECTWGGIRLTDPSSWLTPFRWFNPPDPTAAAADLASAVLAIS